MAAQGPRRRLHRCERSGKLSRLVGLLTRYGRAIRADLQHYYGVDVGELWRRREVERVLDLVDHLPSTSNYTAAVHDDDEVAEFLAQQQAETRPSGPPLTQWSAEVQHLAVIADALHSIRALFLQANGAKGVKPPPPMPRPDTASSRWRTRERDDVREHVMSRLLPGRREPLALTEHPHQHDDE